ncbi:hypothetical protein GC177_08030 [bacterium]|nr:hypothetical protein [bacterium]
MIALWKRGTPLLQRLFGIDVRALALLRVMLGFTTVLGTLFLWTQLGTFFTDDGLLPRRLAVDYGSYEMFPAWFSLFFVTGEAWFLHIMFAFTCLCGVALMLGYRSRLACFLCWLLTTSMISRISPYVVGCDMQLKVLFFWSMFLPLGKWASIDRLREGGKDAPSVYLSFASAGLLLQVLYLYVFGGLFKTTGTDWDESGLGLYYALNIVQHNSIFAQTLASIGLPYIKWLNFYVLYLEIFAFALLFLPVFTYPARLIGQVLLILLHLGFVAFLSIGIFPLVSITGLTAFTSPMVWKWLGRSRFLNALSSRMGQWLKRLDPRLPATPAPPAFPRHMADAREAALALLALLVLWQNMAILPFLNVSFPAPFKQILSHIGLYQHWGVYAPNVPHRSDWFVVEGELRDGKKVDAYRLLAEPPRNSRPHSGYDAHPYPRWLYYMMRVNWAYQGGYFGQYICRRWNSGAMREEYGPIKHVRVYQYWQDTPLPGGVFSEPTRQLDYEQDCPSL